MRVEQIGDATLYCGDCLEILPTLGKVDAVVTDPPFNAGKQFANDNLSLKEWEVFCENFAHEILNIKPENILIEIGKNDIVMRSIFDKYFHYRWAIVLNYTNSMRNGAIGYSNYGLVFWYGGKCYKRYKDRIDSALHSTINDFRHPAPKEINHYQKLVEMFSKEFTIVCDPFMGSGTTGVACINLGRKFVGIEIEPTYFDIARKRIEQARQQLKLAI